MEVRRNVEPSLGSHFEGENWTPIFPHVKGRHTSSGMLIFTPLLRMFNFYVELLSYTTFQLFFLMFPSPKGIIMIKNNRLPFNANGIRFPKFLCHAS